MHYNRVLLFDFFSVGALEDFGALALALTVCFELMSSVVSESSLDSS